MTKPRSARAPLEGQIALFTNKETPDAFRKAVQIVHSKPKSPVSLLQRKLGNAWAKHAVETPPDETGWWTLGIRDLAIDVGFDSNNRQYLKEAAEALMRIVFEWDVMAPTSKRAPWKASVLFPEVEIHADVIRYQISSQMRELIVNPEIYALIDMNVVRRFRRTASLAIWEFCVRFEKLGRSAEVEWQKLRDMVLGETADAKTYSEYKYFKAKVLKPALREINAESNLSVELVETKVGKRVESVRFDIARRSITGEEGSAGDTDAQALEPLGEMVRLGIAQSEARRLLRTHPLDDVRAAVEYTRRRMDEPRGEPLDNPAAYFRNALQHRYAAAGPKPSAEAASPRIDLRAVYLEARVADAQRYFDELDAADRAVLVARYEAQQATAPLRLGRRPTKAAQAAFRRWLAHDTWGEPGAEALVEFAQQLLAEKKVAKF